MTLAPGAAPLRLEAIALWLGGQPLFPPVNATVPAGTCLTLMGPSGCGKSSLLGFLAGTLGRPFVCHGRVLLGDEALNPLPPERRRLGMLFQNDLLFPHLSVGGNLAFALPAAVKPRQAREDRIADALASAGLAGCAGRDPATLSGGQRSRVALLRTLLAAPRALLLDEPFSALDAALRQDFREFVFSHARALGLPMVLVTHDPADAAAAGGPVLHLATG